MALSRFQRPREPVRRGELAVLGEAVQRRVPGRLDAVGFERGAEAVARLAVGEQDGEGEVRGALDRLLVERQLDAVDVREALAVGPHDRAPSGDALLQPLQAAQSQRRSRLVEAVVEADVDDVVVAGSWPWWRSQVLLRHRVRAQQAHAVGEALIGRRDHAALAHAQLLLGEEAERSELSDGADLAAGVVEAGADRLGAVLDQDQPVLVAQLA